MKDKVEHVVSRVGSAGIELEVARSKIKGLEIENIKDEVNFMKSQSMRNILIF